MPTRSRLKADSPSTAQPEQVVASLTPSDDGLPNRIGVVIDGRYRIDDLIAEGGMGVVFRARNLRLDRDVAVKVFHPATSPMPHGEVRFEREAKAIARLDHANCVSVQDFGHLGDGSLFLVMPYLEGVVLTDAIAGVPMESGRALHIAHHLLRGIAHAHAAGIVHRDIKPDNILLVRRDDDDAVPVILDFGIAKTTESEEDENPDARLTRVGQRFGTPAYMSPEQVTGTNADARSDLYSLSVVLFEMLAGKAPFAGNSQETMMMHVTHEVPDLNDCVPEKRLSEQIVRLVAKGLAKDPNSRFQSAEEFLHALDACCALPEVTPALLPANTIGQHTSVLPTPAGNEAPSGQAKLVSRLRAKTPELLRSRTFRFAVGVAVLALLLVLVWPTGSATNHAKHAEQLLAAGKPSEAIAYLEEQQPAVSKRDGAMLQLGHAYAALRRHSDAVDAYKQAHALNKKYAENTVMQTNLMLMLEDNSDATAGVAGRFLVEDLEFEAASTRIAEIASGHRTLRHRHLMRTLAEEFDLELDRTQSYQLDLLQEDDCEDRKTVVAKLRAIGNPSSIVSLKRARKRANNLCLRADATAAIQYLQSIEDSGSETNSQ